MRKDLLFQSGKDELNRRQMLESIQLVANEIHGQSHSNLLGYRYYWFYVSFVAIVNIIPNFLGKNSWHSHEVI